MKELKNFLVSTGSEHVNIEAERFEVKADLRFFIGDDLIAHFPAFAFFKRVEPTPPVSVAASPNQEAV